jgi:Transposase IS66 family
MYTVKRYILTSRPPFGENDEEPLLTRPCRIGIQLCSASLRPTAQRNETPDPQRRAALLAFETMKWRAWNINTSTMGHPGRDLHEGRNRLTRFLDHPELELSNNATENSMRPVAIGRNYEQSGIMQSWAREENSHFRCAVVGECWRSVESLWFSRSLWIRPYFSVNRVCRRMAATGLGIILFRYADWLHANGYSGHTIHLYTQAVERFGF